LSVFDPPLWGQNKVVAASLVSKPLEFERFKTWIAKLFPKPEELNGAAASHPVVDDRKGLLRIPIPGDVGQLNVVLLVPVLDCDRATMNFNSGSVGFIHSGMVRPSG
jgi:hypothetical protein